MTASSFTVSAADNVKPAYVQQNKSSTVSNRLIVKFKPARWTSIMSKAQIITEMMRPFTADALNQLQMTAGVALAESHAISNGAHIVILQGSPDKQAVNQAISNIRGLSDVEYVEEDRILTTQAVPNDASYGNLWAMQPVIPVASPVPGSSGNYGADFQSAWTTSSGTGVVVAVVDTGITPHVDIVGPGGTISPATGNLVSPGYDFISHCRIRGTTATSGCAANFFGNTTVAPTPDASDTGDYITLQDMIDNPSLFPAPSPLNPIASSWHGTHVSGTIAAIGNNGVGVIGGAYSARILPVRVLGKGGGYTSDISEGIRWAANVHPIIANPYPAKVINLSLGGLGSCGTSEQDAINAAVASGAVIVVAAGNSNDDVAKYSPANCNNVITVAAIGRDGLRAAYSNYSSPSSNTANPVKVTIAAQGADMSLSGFDPGILSTSNSSLTTPNLTTGSAYAYHQGTSMATPHVSAAVALMLARTPSLTPARIKTILAASVTAFPTSNTWALYDCATLNNCGAGILNARLAVQDSALPYSAATAMAATKNSNGSSGGGGCSIMPADGNPDMSLLLALCAILSYSFRQRLMPRLGKD
ncbi:MAG TPA: S8 family serine peptidase [Gallionellaceae bacterium]|nr:S8 family serine peptidase [Gallionellaceae bacterium]